jgi:hypothetical protein
MDVWDVLDDDMIPGSGLIPLFGLALYMKSELSPEGTICMKGEYLLSSIPLFFNQKGGSWFSQWMVSEGNVHVMVDVDEWMLMRL